MAMLELLRGMDGNRYTVHGFRSTFRDWAGDRTHYAREVIEHALAHHIKDKAEASYRRSAALDKRRQLMEAWAKYCSSPAQPSGQVVALSATARAR
jgi:integrase